MREKMVTDIWHILSTRQWYVLEFWKQVVLQCIRNAIILPFFPWVEDHSFIKHDYYKILWIKMSHSAYEDVLVARWSKIEDHLNIDRFSLCLCRVRRHRFASNRNLDEFFSLFFNPDDTVLEQWTALKS